MALAVSKVFAASLDELYEMLGFIVEQARLQGFSEDWVSKIELASEEALVNIVSYGYPARKGSIDISCQPAKSPGLTITIKDQGVAYNPLTNRTPFDPNGPLEVRGIGGYGVFFILKVMDEVDYKRENQSNILIMTKFKQTS